MFVGRLLFHAVVGMNPDQKKSEQNLDGFCYASVQIPGNSDEDRYYVSLTKAELLGPSSHELFAKRRFCSFGVYDGHGGSEGAEICKNNLHSHTRRYLNLLEKEVNIRDLNSLENITSKTVFDTMFSLSIKAAHIDLDKEIKANSNAGSTALSLFIFELPNGGFRAYCCWVGDSKCLACYYDKEKSCPISMWMSQDHKPDLRREVERINEKAYIDVFTLPYEVDEVTFRDPDNSNIPVLDEASSFLFLYGHRVQILTTTL